MAAVDRVRYHCSDCRRAILPLVKWRVLKLSWEPHLAVEGFSPIKAGVIEVWVTDCYGLQASQGLDLLQSLLVQVAETVPQYVALRGLQVTECREYPAALHGWQVQMPQAEMSLSCGTLSSA